MRFVIRKNSAGEYFKVRHQDLPSLIHAEGRIADWDEFNHVVLEEEPWSRNWKKLELGGRCTVVDQTGWRGQIFHAVRVSALEVDVLTGH